MDARLKAHGVSNRHERRAAASALKKLPSSGAKRDHVAEAICAVRGHVLAELWVMRPAIVGAGIVIPKVHFDRNCSRCGKLDSVWADIEGPTKPQAKWMTLTEWLEANGAGVPAPAGEIRVPDQAELDRIAKLVRRQP